MKRLRSEGIEVTRIIVFLDRQQGGIELLASEGYEVHSVVKLLDVVDLYLQEGMIDRDQHQRVSDFIQTHQFEKPLWT